MTCCRCGQRRRWGGRDRSWCHRRRNWRRSNLPFFHSHGGEAPRAGHLGNLADGEREATCHGHESGNDDHLTRLGSCTHTPTWRATIDKSWSAV